jgi:hypothetical protein
MTVKLYRAYGDPKPNEKVRILDNYAHLQHPSMCLMTRCHQPIESAASVKGKELCDRCIDAAGRE